MAWDGTETIKTVGELIEALQEMVRREPSLEDAPIWIARGYNFPRRAYIDTVTAVLDEEESDGTEYEVWLADNARTPDDIPEYAPDEAWNGGIENLDWVR